MSKLTELNDKLQDLKKTIRLEAEEAVNDHIISHLNDLDLPEEIVGVTWAQYTPYFNDGDSCEFSVGEPELVATSFEGVEYVDDTFEDLRQGTEEDDQLFYAGGWSLRDTKYQELYEAVKDIFNFDEDFYELVYDNHVRVLIYKDKDEWNTQVTYYDHD